MTFFRQWLFRPDLPELRLEWRWDEAAGEAVVDVAQVQAGEPFELELDLSLVADPRTERRTLALRGAAQSFRLRLPFAPEAIEADPDGWLLAPTAVRQR